MRGLGSGLLRKKGERAKEKNKRKKNKEVRQNRDGEVVLNGVRWQLGVEGKRT